MKFHSLIEEIARQFILHWNQHEMDKLADHLADNIVVRSPNIMKVFPDVKESEISGKDNVMNYWSILNRNHFFQMNLLHMEGTDKLIRCKIDIGRSDLLLHASFRMNEYGNFAEINIEYY